MWFFILCPPVVLYLKVVKISYFSLSTVLPAVLVENHKFSKNQQMAVTRSLLLISVSTFLIHVCR